jgi:hypothetical protein
MWNILDGKLKPVAWSPGAVSWVDQFRERWAQQGNRPAVTAACKPSVYSPIGLAMWRPMAETLGWPDKPIGWQTIVDLASDPQCWKRILALSGSVTMPSASRSLRLSNTGHAWKACWAAKGGRCAVQCPRPWPGSTVG